MELILDAGDAEELEVTLQALNHGGDLRITLVHAHLCLVETTLQPRQHSETLKRQLRMASLCAVALQHESDMPSQWVMGINMQ